MYVPLAGICIHFLVHRGKQGRAHRVILGYTLVMFCVSTIYFVYGCKWSEIEFVESTVNIGVYASLQDSRLAILKDTAFTVNIWLADSLLVRLSLYMGVITY